MGRREPSRAVCAFVGSTGSQPFSCPGFVSQPRPLWTPRLFCSKPAGVGFSSLQPRVLSSVVFLARLGSPVTEPRDGSVSRGHCCSCGVGHRLGEGTRPALLAPGALEQLRPHRLAAFTESTDLSHEGEAEEQDGGGGLPRRRLEGARPSLQVASSGWGGKVSSTARPYSLGSGWKRRRDSFRQRTGQSSRWEPESSLPAALRNPALGECLGVGPWVCGDTFLHRLQHAEPRSQGSPGPPSGSPGRCMSSQTVGINKYWMVSSILNTCIWDF